jgi:hypothetical protein
MPDAEFVLHLLRKCGGKHCLKAAAMLSLLTKNLGGVLVRSAPVYPVLAAREQRLRPPRRRGLNVVTELNGFKQLFSWSANTTNGPASPLMGDHDDMLVELSSADRSDPRVGKSTLSASREERRVEAHFHPRMLLVLGQHGYAFRDVSGEAVRVYQAILIDVSGGIVECVEQRLGESPMLQFRCLERHLGARRGCQHRYIRSTGPSNPWRAGCRWWSSHRSGRHRAEQAHGRTCPLRDRSVSTNSNAISV